MDLFVIMLVVIAIDLVVILLMMGKAIREKGPKLERMKDLYHSIDNADS